MDIRLNNYFMRPTFIDYIGDVYPIRLFEYDEFNELSSKYILAGRKWFTNILKYPKDEYILDYYIKSANEIESIKSEYDYIKYVFDNKDILEDYIEQNNIDIDMYSDYIENVEKSLSNKSIIYNIGEIERLFSMILRKKVKYKYLNYNEGVIDYIFEVEGGDYAITKYNFENLRECVMAQNLMYEPLTSPSDEGNRIIQEAIESLSKNGIKRELESICSIVSVYKSINDEELFNYTYYRLMVDFESIVRINDNLFIYMLRSQGCDGISPTYLAEKVEVDKNPYNGLFQKYKENSLDKRLKQQ